MPTEGGGRAQLEGSQSAGRLDSGLLRACPLGGPGQKGLSQRADWTQVRSAHAHSGAPAGRVGGCWRSSSLGHDRGTGGQDQLHKGSDGLMTSQ